jgi:hypothetical protein
VLEDDRRGLRPGAPEADAIAVVQGGPCRIERLGQAG